MLTDSDLKKAGELLVATLRQKSKARLQENGRGIWTGKMIDAIDAQIITDADGDVGIEILGEYYQDFVDQGVNGVGYQKTKGGKADKRFKTNRSVVTKSPFSYRDKKPPVDQIRPWAVAHGISPWAVVNSIYRKGIKPMNFFNDVLNEELEKFTDYLAEAQADDILNGFGDE